MNQSIRLAALDLDGTLFNKKSEVSPEDQRAIRAAVDAGVEVIISTGRPYVGLPVPLLCELGIRYAITANGAGIYQLPEKKLLFASRMETGVILPIVRELQKLDIHMDAFINGDAYSMRACYEGIDRLSMPSSVRHYIKTSRIFTDDLAELIEREHFSVEKMTLNFYREPGGAGDSKSPGNPAELEDGDFRHRAEAKAILSAHGEVSFLTGGYHNLEFTKAGTTKGGGLLFLCEMLSIPQEQTLACGDTQNDLDILKTAAIGVAMGNAQEELREVADFVTLSNEKSGVAHALRRYVPGL